MISLGSESVSGGWVAFQARNWVQVSSYCSVPPALSQTSWATFSALASVSGPVTTSRPKAR